MFFHWGHWRCGTCSFDKSSEAKATPKEINPPRERIIWQLMCALHVYLGELTVFLAKLLMYRVILKTCLLKAGTLKYCLTQTNVFAMIELWKCNTSNQLVKITNFCKKLVFRLNLFNYLIDKGMASNLLILKRALKKKSLAWILEKGTENKYLLLLEHFRGTTHINSCSITEQVLGKRIRILFSLLHVRKAVC